MRIGIVSDIHINVYLNGNNTTREIENFINTYFKFSEKYIPEVLIIAGDIAEDNKIILEFLNKLNRLYPNLIILYTYGNHEMWNTETTKKIQIEEIISMYNNLPQEEIDKKIKNLKRNKSSKFKIKELKKEIKKFSTVFLLDNEVIEIKNIKFIGTPMWYDFSYGIQKLDKTKKEMFDLWKKYMYDAINIYWDKKEQFNPLKFYDEKRKKLENLLKREKYVDVIFSHVGPIVPENMPEKWKNNPGNSFFYFDGKELLEKYEPKLWIFGHTHDAYDFKYQNTRLICNPFGYKNENNNKNIKIIEI